jgi:hypothetical protein
LSKYTDNPSHISFSFGYNTTKAVIFQVSRRIFIKVALSILPGITRFALVSKNIRKILNFFQKTLDICFPLWYIIKAASKRHSKIHQAAGFGGQSDGSIIPQAAVFGGQSDRSIIHRTATI